MVRHRVEIQRSVELYVEPRWVPQRFAPREGIGVVRIRCACRRGTRRTSIWCGCAGRRNTRFCPHRNTLPRRAPRPSTRPVSVPFASFYSLFRAVVSSGSSPMQGRRRFRFTALATDAPRRPARVRAEAGRTVWHEPLRADGALYWLGFWRLERTGATRFEKLRDGPVPSCHLAELTVADVEQVEDRSGLQSGRPKQQLYGFLFQGHAPLREARREGRHPLWEPGYPPLSTAVVSTRGGRPTCPRSSSPSLGACDAARANARVGSSLRELLRRKLLLPCPSPSAPATQEFRPSETPSRPQDGRRA